MGFNSGFKGLMDVKHGSSLKGKNVAWKCMFHCITFDTCMLHLYPLHVSVHCVIMIGWLQNTSQLAVVYLMKCINMLSKGFFWNEKVHIVHLSFVKVIYESEFEL